MNASQAPLGTPFSASSTASEVLDRLDLTGQEVIVTGGHSRLGREVGRTLAAAGAAVTVAARDPQRAAVAVAGIAGVACRAARPHRSRVGRGLRSALAHL